MSLPVLEPGAALLLLRVFLGATFVYAGIQKLADPGFLHPGAPTYIGTQLHGFANHTPGGFLLKLFALPHPQLAGVVVALTEIAVGLLVLAGLLTRAAALVGLSLNLVLFLTNSWRTYPYFLGSDIVFVFAWLPFVLAGAAGQPALDHRLLRAAERSQPPPDRGVRLGVSSGSPARERAPATTRRQLLGRALAASALGTLVLGGVASLAKGRYRGGGAARKLASAPPPSTPATPTPARPAAKPALPRGARRLGSGRQLPVGQGAVYQDPQDGRPDIVVRKSDGSLAAFSAVCPHAGCNVQYQQGALYCPCHASIFSAETGAVQQGPAVDPLAVKRVVESGGDIYALPA